MSLATLESAIVLELRQITGRSKLKKKDLLAWCTTDNDSVKPENENEIQVFCPSYKVYCVIPKA
jgi:hypothetical protein